MRRHYLDNIRWMTVVAVVVYHVISLVLLKKSLIVIPSPPTVRTMVQLEDRQEWTIVGRFLIHRPPQQLKITVLPEQLHGPSPFLGPARGNRIQADLRDLTAQRNEHRLPVLTLMEPEDRKSTRLTPVTAVSRMPSSA